MYAATRRFEASAWIRSWTAAKWHRDALASFGAQGTLALTKTGLTNRLATACALVAAASGADIATLRNLTSTNLKSITIDGGLDTDRLILDNTIADNVQRFINWESIELTKSSQLTFNGTLKLGDAGTGTGTLSLDPTSTVFAARATTRLYPSYQVSW
jgi:hypothetical protein